MPLIDLQVSVNIYSNTDDNLVSKIEIGNILSGVILLDRIMMYNLLGGPYLREKTNNHEV